MQVRLRDSQTRSRERYTEFAPHVNRTDTDGEESVVGRAKRPNRLTGRFYLLIDRIQLAFATTRPLAHVHDALAVSSREQVRTSCS